MSWPTRTLIEACVGLLLLAGCDVYDKSFLEPEDAGVDAATDARADGGPDASPDAPPPDAAPDARDAGPEDTGVDAGCGRNPPPRPTAEDGDGEDVVFALRDVEFAQNAGAWRSIGYDLDGLCTTTEAPDVECDSVGALALPTDGDEGIDNALGRELSQQVLLADPSFEVDAEAQMTSGRAAVVIWLRGYNGLDDDPRVDAVVGQSIAAVPSSAASPDGGVPDPADFDGGLPPPAWDGSDLWWVSDADFVDGNEALPRIRDDLAYVSGRTLVLRLPDRSPIVFPWSGNRITLALTDAVITGRIDESGTRLEDVVLAGRWAIVDIVTALTAAGLCPGTTERLIVDELVRRTADVRSAEGSGGEGVSCDALSMGLGFTGYRALWGGLGAVPDEPSLCP